MLRACDLITVFEIMAILEALHIFFNVLKKFIETFISVGIVV
jgi:hypothetical protein